MTKRTVSKAFSPKHSDYRKLVSQIQSQVESARYAAFRAATKAQVGLYWTIGEGIASIQEKHNWGDAVVESLSQDLSKWYPDSFSFSPRNLWLMRQMYTEYRYFAAKLKQPASELQKLKQLASEIPWWHNVLIMQKIETLEERKYYLRAAREMGWSRNVLLNQIKGDAYGRQARAKQHNFPSALPKHLAEQADQAMKDVYMLDFLGIAHPVLERELESRMIACIRDVLLEFGHGFSFIGSQYVVSTPTKDYRVDLLFYQRKLQCLVAVDLKAGSFEPEFAGKMNFYLNLLDDTMKEPHENPSIGIILCAERDRFEVEYALRGIEKPVGVAEYHLTKVLPRTLKGALPSPAQIKKKLEKELKKKCQPQKTHRGRHAGEGNQR